MRKEKKNAVTTTAHTSACSSNAFNEHFFSHLCLQSKQRSNRKTLTKHLFKENCSFLLEILQNSKTPQCWKITKMLLQMRHFGAFQILRQSKNMVGGGRVRFPLWKQSSFVCSLLTKMCFFGRSSLLRALIYYFSFSSSLQGYHCSANGRMAFAATADKNLLARSFTWSFRRKQSAVDRISWRSTYASRLAATSAYSVCQRYGRHFGQAPGGHDESRCGLASTQFAIPCILNFYLPCHCGLPLVPYMWATPVEQETCDHCGGQ